MRAFYEEDTNESQQTIRQYYVKIDNIAVDGDLKGFKIIKASTAAELKDRIYEVYNFNDAAKKYIQLWSAPLGVSTRIRLDKLIYIPKTCEEIYVRGVSNNSME
jgi:hypothetical protein